MRKNVETKSRKMTNLLVGADGSSSQNSNLQLPQLQH